MSEGVKENGTETSNTENAVANTNNAVETTNETNVRKSIHKYHIKFTIFNFNFITTSSSSSSKDNQPKWNPQWQSSNLL